MWQDVEGVTEFQNLACSINYDKCDVRNEAAQIFGSETNNQKVCMGNVINEDLACSINYDKCDGINEAARIFGLETNNQRV